jgi:hypothetical protein
MNDITIKELGEYVPSVSNSVSMNKLKEFTIIPYFIDWYGSESSKKVFPIFFQEISDLNPTSFQIPGVLTRNPFFDHTRIKYFAAYKNNIPAGRIAAFIDLNFNTQHNSNTGWFGLFESVEDSNVANLLIETAIGYLKENKCNKAVGPAKFNASGEIGCLIEGFDKKPYFLEPYNAPYYGGFFENYGFAKENDWYAMGTDVALGTAYMERIQRVLGKTNGTKREFGNNSGFKLRNADFSKLKTEIQIIRDLYNEIWNKGNHPQQTVLTEKEFDILAKGIKAVAIEDLLFIYEKENKPIGVSISLPDINEVIYEYDRNTGAGGNKKYIPSRNFFALKDLNRDLKIFNIINRRLKEKKFDGLRILILGIKEEYRKTGIDSQLYFETFKRATELGFKTGSGSQLADINFDILNPLFKIGKLSMTWRVYTLDI